MRTTPINMGGLGYIHIGKQPQLFVDDFLVEQRERVAWIVNQPVKDAANPVLRCDRPWEANNVWLHGNVLYDQEEALFKMWYQTWRWPSPGQWSGAPNEQYVCYAISDDGLVWTKPELGLVAYEADRATNILLRNPDPNTCLFHRSVVKDYLDPDLARRYKMMVYVLPSKQVDPSQPAFAGPAGIYLAFSRDGIHWTDYLDHHVPVESHDTPNLFFDARRQQWFIPTKYHAAMPSRTSSPGRRSRGIAVSDTLQNWQPAISILEPDAEDPSATEFYHKEILAIYDNLYVAGLGVYHTDPSDDTMDIQLVTSRDGRHWQRAGNRQLFLPLGPAGSFDNYMIMELASNTLLVDDELWIYYTGADAKHYAQHNGAIGRARLQRDRFIAASAGEEPGRLLTRPISVEGNALQINAEADSGWVSVEILDPQGVVLTGFSVGECVACQVDALRHQVQWRSNADLSQLQGQVVRLAFHLQNAKLYAFQFA